MTEQEFEELAAGYALNALSDHDRDVFVEAQASHPEWAHHVAAAVDTAALLAHATPDVEPPPSLRSAILASLEAPSPAGVPASDAPVGSASTGSWRRGWFALAASIALVAVVGLGTLVVSSLTAPPAAVVALEKIEAAADAQSASVTMDDGSQATAYWSASLGEAVLTTDGMPTLASDQTYELWFVRGDEAIPAGTFDTTDGSVVAELAGGFVSGDAIAVTVEAAGGSPTGSPTTTPLFVITT
ncbi:anti-sigma-K factor RskA [Microbacterium sediminicola]|uniref:Regulator of SigK n=1 Tax=Microbacterium sediminicola TaxID=415210 RepID=A0ABP4UIM1_9MICO